MAEMCATSPTGRFRRAVGQRRAVRKPTGQWAAFLDALAGSLNRLGNLLWAIAVKP